MPKKELVDLMSQRAALLDSAQAALTDGQQEKYTEMMQQATAMNAQITDIKNLMDEQARFAAMSAPVSALAPDAAGRVEEFVSTGRMSISVDDAIAGMGLDVKNSTTLASGSLAKPTEVSPTIRDKDRPVSSVIDEVSVEGLEGMGTYLVPYVKAEQAAQGGKVTTQAGKARTLSDPTFGYVKISPFEVSVTSLVDRNIRKLTPVAYEAKIRSMALQALRRKVAGYICLGDGQASPDMFGIIGAKDVDGNFMSKTMEVTSFTEDTLHDLMYSYGTDEDVAGGARLYLNKRDLQAIGEFRGTNEKKRLFEVVANGNTGTIRDGGFIMPYTINSNLTPLSTATQGATAISTMFFGNPMHYLLGLFGQYSIRIDESVKSVERMMAVLGDVFVGGNVVVHEGFTVVSLAASS